MRILQLTAATVAILAAISIGTAGGAQRRPDSGIHGRVLYGPTCPVERPGHTCVRPYQASFTIRRMPAGTVASQVRSGAAGTFTARLRPGLYVVAPHNGSPFPRAQSQTVSVRRHHFTEVVIRFDSGIR